MIRIVLFGKNMNKNHSIIEFLPIMCYTIL